MFGKDFKSLKFLTYGSQNTSALNRSLSDFSTRMQMQSNIIATVSDFADDGDVIFTTPKGITFKSASKFHLSLGDMVRVEIDNNGRYNLVSIFKKSNDRVNSILDNIKLDYLPEADKEFSVTSSDLGNKKNIITDAKFIEFDPELKALDTDSSLYKFFQNTYSFKAKILSIESFDATYEESPIMTLVDLLQEIQNDELEDEFSFGAKVLKTDQDGTLLKTLYGTILVKEDLSSFLGLNILMRVVDDSEILQNSILSQHSFINNLIQLTNSFKYIHGAFGFDFILKKIFHNINKTSKETKENSFFEKIKDEFKDNYKTLSEERILDGWYSNIIKLNFQESIAYQKIYFMQESYSKSRFVINLDLSKFGPVQIDTILNHTKTFSGKKIDYAYITIMHKNILSPTILKSMELIFTKLSSSINMKTSINIKQSDQFYQVEEQEIEHENSLENKGSIII
jgi:hypothetical protein